MMAQGGRRRSRDLFLAVLCAAALACSGSSPTQPPPVSPPKEPSPAPTPTPQATPPTGTVSCPLGKGDVDAFCARDTAAHLGDVDAAIDQLVKERPQLFNLNDPPAPGSYRVLDVEGYFAGVIKNLQAKGFCAGQIGAELQVKRTNDFSEEYDILLASGHIRRGDRSYLKTCTPAAFPLEPEDVIANVPIFIYGMQCPGYEPQRPYNKQIPVGCTALITATPKDRNGNDVDPRIHGSQIHWDLREGKDKVRLDDFPDVPFNKKVVGREEGDFILCAVLVKNIEGCFDGKVVP